MRANTALVIEPAASFISVGLFGVGRVEAARHARGANLGVSLWLDPQVTRTNTASIAIERKYLESSCHHLRTVGTTHFAVGTKRKRESQKSKRKSQSRCFHTFAF